MSLLAAPLFLLCASPAFPQAEVTASTARPPRIDFVLDLDWTLLYQIRDPRQVTDTTRLLRAGGDTYRLADNAAQFIEYLASIPGARVSFFSGGERERNIEILRQIRLSDGRTAADFNVFGKEDLSAVEPSKRSSGTPGFAERFKKDLRKVLPDIDLERAVLVDDTIRFPAAGQQRNLLSLDPTFDFIENYGAFSGRRGEPPWSGLKYLPSTRRNWALERRKLERAAGLIEEARIRSAETGRSFTAVLHELQHDPKGFRLFPLGPDQLRYYDLGRELLGDGNSTVDLPCRTRYRVIKTGTSD